jgi:radical SAM protein with 4Fe4S-binding SPASM domain
LIAKAIWADTRLRSSFWMYRAARNGDKARVVELLAAKIKLNAVDPFGRDCLLGAFRARNWSLFEWLLMTGGADLRYLLRILVRQSDPVPLFDLLDHLTKLAPLQQPMLGTVITPVSTRPCSLIEVLIRVGRGRHLVAALDRVFAAGKDCLEESDIPFAASTGNMAVINCLLRHGGSLDARNNEGESALTVAAALWHLNIATQLVKKGADVRHAIAWLRYHNELYGTIRFRVACLLMRALRADLWSEMEGAGSFVVLGSTATVRAFSDSLGFCGGARHIKRDPEAFISLTAIPSYVRKIFIEDNPQYLRHYLCNLHWDCLRKIEVWLATPQEDGEFKLRRSEPMDDGADLVDDFELKLPLAAEVEPINWCNLRCRYCHVSFMEEPNIFRLGSRALANMDGLEGAFVQVGSAFEPMLHKQFPAIVDHLSDLHCEIGVITNGTLLNDAAIDSMVRSNLYAVQISFDAGSPESYAYIRQRGDFEETTMRIRKLRDALRAAGKKTLLILSVVLMRCNIDELRAMIDLAEDLGVDILGFQFLVLRFAGDPILTGDSLDSMLEETYRKLDAAAEYAIQEQKNVVLSCPYFAHSPLSIRYQDHFHNGLVVPNSQQQSVFYLNKYVVLQLGQHPRMSHNCVSPYTFARINADGDVSVCRDFIIGNLNKASLTDLWFGPTAHRIREFIIANPSVCGACEHYKYCLQPGLMNDEAPELLGNDMQYQKGATEHLQFDQVAAGIVAADQMSNEAGKLFRATAEANLSAIRGMIAAGTLPGLALEDGTTALHLAVRANRPDAVAELLSRAAPVDARDVRGRTPLVIAVARKARQVEDILCAAGADVHYLLAYGVRHGQITSVERALALGANPSIAAGNGVGLINEALQHGMGLTVFALLRAGANANIPDDQGVSPLHRAAILGDLRLVKALVDSGADQEPRTPEGTTPLMLACLHGHSQIVLYLQSLRITQAGDLAAGDDTLLLALRGGHMALAKMLLEHGHNIENRNKNGLTPLLRAAQQGNLEVVQQLVGLGASITAVDDLGNNAVIYAAMGGHQSVGEWLIATGADPTSTNQMGEDFAYILRREVHSAWNN